MMTVLSIYAALLLGGYLLMMARWCGIPDMVSDTYYQLRMTAGQGWPFSVVLCTSALMLMVCMLTSGKGMECFAFVGCAGLCFVALAPDYLDRDEYAVHKTAALLAASACTAWSLSACWWPTVVTAIAYLLYTAARIVYPRLHGVTYATSQDTEWHPWYWAEVLCFANTFATYWIA